MRYLLLIASALWLIARAVAHHTRLAVRRRGHRVRRYAESPLPAGPVTLILPSQRTGTVAPPLPPQHRRIAAPVPVDMSRIDQTRLGVGVLLDISHPVPAGRMAVAA